MKNWWIVLSIGYLLSGCAATQVALEHKDLQVTTKMSSTIFLDLEDDFEKTIYIDVRNTSDLPLSLSPMIIAHLAQRGYHIKQHPKDAYYILQANVLQAGKTSISAAKQSLYSGFGGTLVGAAVGGVATRSRHGIVVGGLVGTAAEVIASSLVKNVTYSIIVDIQISERSSVVVRERTKSQFQQGDATKISQTARAHKARKKYQTRAVALANKVNLEFFEAEPFLKVSLARSISGIF